MLSRGLSIFFLVVLLAAVFTKVGSVYESVEHKLGLQLVKTAPTN